jgi:hypothetical protein
MSASMNLSASLFRVSLSNMPAISQDCNCNERTRLLLSQGSVYCSYLVACCRKGLEYAEDTQPQRTIVLSITFFSYEESQFNLSLALQRVPGSNSRQSN